MISKNFAIKSALCDIEDLHSFTESLETKWLESILLKARVPKPMLKNKKSGKIGNAKWRDYLFEGFRITISKKMDTNSVEVFKYSETANENVKVGEWSYPVVVRMTDKKKPYYRLDLKYWQII